MLTAPYDHPLNLTMQAVLTFGSWGLTILLLIIAFKKDKRDGSPFYSFLILAVLVGAYAEPLYDVGFMLWFYTPGIWSHFTAFAIPQPNWTHSGYVVLYAGTAMFLCEQFKNNLASVNLYKWFFIALSLSMVFEIAAIQGGTYTYWGPHAFRVLDYPLVIGVLEAAQVIVFSVAAMFLKVYARSKISLFSLFALFPCTFYVINFGLGSPLIIALHLETEAPMLIKATSLLSMIAALYAVRISARAISSIENKMR